MKAALLTTVLTTLLVFTAAAEPVVKSSSVVVEVVKNQKWTRLSGQVEATTDLSIASLEAVITDWAAYPRLFPKVKSIDFVADGAEVLVSERTEVSAMGFKVVNGFTIRVDLGSGEGAGSRRIRWKQERTDGTIDRLEGSWQLFPKIVDGKPGTGLLYTTVSSVPLSFPGQDGIVSLFFPGELKMIVESVLKEARKNKEKS